MTRPALFALFFVLAACGADSAGTPAQPDAAGPVDAGDDGETAASPQPASLADTVAAACPGAKVKSNPPNSLSAGSDLHKVTLDAPGAVCNDGTPAVMYVRAATTPQAQSRWVLHTQGGASCRGYEQCVDRWCGDQSPVYDQSKMTSAHTPETIGGKGIFHSDAALNPFAAMNQVFFYYCSSDQWQGRNLETVLTAQTGEQMVMPMAGFRILEAAVAALKAGVTSDDGEVTMPPLDEATLALWTGVSAGSTGAQHTVDWFAGQVPEATRVVGVFDAGVFIDPEVIDDPAVAQSQRERVDEAWAGNIADIDGFVDESCLAAEPEEHHSRCLDTHYTKRNHMSTPFFQRADLADPASSKSFLEFGGTKAQYAQDTLETIAQYPDTAGLYAPRCGQHVGITNNTWFLSTTVETASGDAVTFAEALRRWLLDMGFENALDDTSGDQSACQSTTGDLS